MNDPPEITCKRCGDEIEVGNRIGIKEGGNVHRSCADEGEIEEWEDYVREMEAKQEGAAEERRRNRANGHL
jgi:hypothetical protein